MHLRACEDALTLNLAFLFVCKPGRFTFHYTLGLSPFWLQYCMSVTKLNQNADTNGVTFTNIIYLPGAIKTLT